MKTITTIEHRVIRKGSMGSDSNRKTYRCQGAVSPHKYKLFERTPRVSTTAASPRRSSDREYRFARIAGGVPCELCASEQEKKLEQSGDVMEAQVHDCVMDTRCWRVYQYLY